MPKFKIVGKPLLGEKYVEGKKERRRKKKEYACAEGVDHLPIVQAGRPKIFDIIFLF